MRKRYSLFAAVLFMCAAAVYWFYPTDENRIRKIIRKSERAIIAEDIDGLMDSISYNYTDDYGNSYLTLKRRFVTVFKRLSDIDIERNIIRISVADKRAETELEVRVIASSPSDPSKSAREYIIGDAGRAQTIKVFLEKSPHKWLITGVGGVLDRTNY